MGGFSEWTHNSLSVASGSKSERNLSNDSASASETAQGLFLFSEYLQERSPFPLHVSLLGM